MICPASISGTGHAPTARQTGSQPTMEGHKIASPTLAPDATMLITMTFRHGFCINTVHGAAIHGDLRLAVPLVTGATTATMISISSRPFQQNHPCTGSSPYSTSLPCICGGCSHLMLTSCLQQSSRIKRLHGWPLQRTDNGPRTSLYGYRTQNPQNIVLQPLQLPVAA